MSLKKTASIFLMLFLALCTACGSTDKGNSDISGNGSGTGGTDETAMADNADTTNEQAAANDMVTAAEASGPEEEGALTVVDTCAFERLPLREISIELTNDNVPDSICMYLLGEPQDDLKEAESLIEHQVRMVQVLVRDGATQDALYDRTFSIAHVGEGELAVVTDGERHYLFESDCYEQMGYASYYVEVFDWNGGEKRIVDEFRADFLISPDAVQRSVINGEEITCREDVIPDFRESIENWNQGSELLIACDTMNSLDNVQSVYVSLEGKQYSLNDFFSSIWERPDYKYTVGTFDNIMGYSGFYIYDETYPFIYRYFYAIVDGQPLCIADAWGYGDLENDNYAIDINGDGVNELICNIMSGADLVGDTVIYYKEGSKILYGHADNMLDEEWDDFGSGSVHSMYLPDEDAVEIFYWKENLQDYQSKKYKIDLSKITFYPFEPQPDR